MVSQVTEAIVIKSTQNGRVKKREEMTFDLYKPTGKVFLFWVNLSLALVDLLRLKR